MDAERFDRLSRLISSPRTRRQTLRAVILGAWPLATRRDVTVAGPGCTNVGRKAKKAKECCSGVVKGKKGKKRCKAHDTGDCQAGQIEGFCGGVDVPCETSTGLPGRCNTTTGNAGYCARNGACVPCTKDVDCEQQGFGVGAACVLCAPCENGRGCATLFPPD